MKKQNKHDKIVELILELFFTLLVMGIGFGLYLLFKKGTIELWYMISGIVFAIIVLTIGVIINKKKNNNRKK